jgi:hypothetical protein
MKCRFSVLSISLCVAGIAVAQGTTAIIVQQYTFAPAGIVTGQSMRLNLSNVAGATSMCTGNFSFINSDGSTIKNENYTVNAGQTMSYSLQTTDISGSPASAEVRGVVKVNRQAGGIVPTPGNPPAPSCSPVMSLEIVDSTGQTHVLLTSPALVVGITAVVPPSIRQ